MPRITYITRDGERHELDVAVGLSVMEGAVKNDIAGIVAECGGACACATCHSYIDEAWLGLLSAPDEIEDAMLDVALDRRRNSRLTCQVVVTDLLDGLVVYVGDNQ